MNKYKNPDLNITTIIPSPSGLSEKYNHNHKIIWLSYSSLKSCNNKANEIYLVSNDCTITEMYFRVAEYPHREKNVNNFLHASSFKSMSKVYQKDCFTCFSPQWVRKTIITKISRVTDKYKNGCAAQEKILKRRGSIASFINLFYSHFYL